jgi:serine/threonine protein kinase
MTGQTLSHFEILDKLGEGGMGVVYKARDTQLNRPVAIKLLRAGKVADQDRRRRFIQEARSASALNHPNIVTIYEIGEASGYDFIAMEFVSGRTLDQMIPRKGMRLNEALKYATQIADALAKAHGAGITHRDLKPSNIIVTEDGRVKILDFGLAKLTEPAISSESNETRTALVEDKPQTSEGTVVGTVAYMSPEQAEGRPVDARSDIFSFGSVLYEMVTGHRAFQGTTSMSTLASVINQEPKPLGELAPASPRELEKLISRCLRKDPNRRAQHIADIKLELDEIREDSESGSLSRSGQVTTRGRESKVPRWMIPITAGLILVAGAGTVLMIKRQPAARVEANKAVVLTSYSGNENYPALSPDGKSVAFSWDGDTEDNLDIYVKLVDAGTPVRLTQNPRPDVLPAWSPDGTFIAFTRFGPEGGYFVIPSLGGQERKIADLPSVPSHRPDPSADWSPDSDALLASGAPGGEMGLWRVLISGGEPVRLANWADGDSYPSISRFANRLAFHRGYSDANLWLADLNDTKSEPARIAASSRVETQPDFSADGSRLAFISWRTGHAEVWTALKDGSNSVQLTTEGARPTAPRWSPDGRKIAFAKRPGGNTDVYIIDAQGGAPRRLTKDPGNDASAYWSNDGKWVYFASNRTGRFEVWKILADGSGSEVQITRNGGWRSTESADGQTLYYQKFEMAGLWRMPLPTGQESKVANLPSGATWYMRADSSYWIAKADQTELRRIDHTTGRDSVIRRLPPRTSAGTGNFAISPDVRTVLFVKSEQAVSDLMLVEDFR